MYMSVNEHIMRCIRASSLITLYEHFWMNGNDVSKSGNLWLAHQTHHRHIEPKWQWAVIQIEISLRANEKVFRQRTRKLMAISFGGHEKNEKLVKWHFGLSSISAFLSIHQMMMMMKSVQYTQIYRYNNRLLKAIRNEIPFFKEKKRQQGICIWIKIFVEYFFCGHKPRFYFVVSSSLLSAIIKTKIMLFIMWY